MFTKSSNRGFQNKHLLFRFSRRILASGITNFFMKNCYHLLGSRITVREDCIRLHKSQIAESSMSRLHPFQKSPLAKDCINSFPVKSVIRLECEAVKWDKECKSLARLAESRWCVIRLLPQLPFQSGLLGHTMPRSRVVSKRQQHRSRDSMSSYDPWNQQLLSNMCWKELEALKTHQKRDESRWH